ncbi:hypothetical protein [Gordonia oryzae]|nr:hypothetical protein [Gordonia oryzae]
MEFSADPQRWFDDYLAAERRRLRRCSRWGFRLVLWDTRIRHARAALV